MLCKLCTCKHLFQWLTLLKKARSKSEKSMSFWKRHKLDNLNSSSIRQKQSKQHQMMQNLHVTSELHLYRTGNCQYRRNSWFRRVHPRHHWPPCCFSCSKWTHPQDYPCKSNLLNHGTGRKGTPVRGDWGEWILVRDDFFTFSLQEKTENFVFHSLRLFQGVQNVFFSS